MTTAPGVLPSLRLARIRAVESAWGTHGVWCRTCRRSTPTEQLQVLPRGTVLRCETCAAELLVLPRQRSTGRRRH